MWSCWRKCFTVKMGFVVSYMLKSCLMLQSSAICEWRCKTLSSFSSVMSDCKQTGKFLTMMIMDETSETVSLPQLNVFFNKSCHGHSSSSQRPQLRQVSITIGQLVSISCIPLKEEKTDFYNNIEHCERLLI